MDAPRRRVASLAGAGGAISPLAVDALYVKLIIQQRVMPRVSLAPLALLGLAAGALGAGLALTGS